MESIIKIENLTKSYGAFHAVDNLNLNIRKGEVFGLLGPNGAGKSTTILMLLGLTEPHSGSAIVCGYNATSNPIEVKRRVGYLPDTLGFYDNRTGLENLVYVGQLNGLTPEKATYKAKQLLTRVGLKDEIHKKVSRYSRGMKQRLGLAEVLIKSPEIIILDEPTLGIDPKGVREFLNLIQKLSKEEQLTVLLSSHNLHQVQQVCDRVGLFVSGKLIAEGDISTLSKTLFNEAPYVIEVKLEETQNKLIAEIEKQLLQLNAVKRVKIENKTLLINCSSNASSSILKTLITANFNMVYFRIKEYGLDDIYQRYFENKNENYKHMA